MTINLIILIFFALPLATIIISIALQRILKCPILVAAIIFAIFLVVTFIVGNLIFLVAAIIYAIIAFITAFLTCIICKLLKRIGDIDCSCTCMNNSRSDIGIATNLLSDNNMIDTNTLLTSETREDSSNFRCSNSNNNGTLSSNE